MRSASLRFPVLLLLLGTATLPAQNVPDYEQPPVSYSATKPHDAAARLQVRLETGELMLTGGDREILRTLLRELKVPIESQVMVFSKTSLQRGRIRPDQPRALYFSDSIYVGWVPGGLIEVAAVDPQLGPIFYTFNPRPERDEKQAFVRDSDCLRCHGGTFVRDVPGVFARSIVPASNGEPLLRHGTELVDDQTPFENRWGGWYVTGYTGAPQHRGNAFGTEIGDKLDFPLSERRPAELGDFFDTSRYLAGTSDVVALLVVEHQMAVQNALTKAAHSCRRMLDYQRSLQKTFKDPITDEPAYDSVKSVFRSAVEDIVDHLLFRGAAPLPAGVTGLEAFRLAFAREAPRSPDGRSLKDFQLRDRLFAHRCSYMIYSDTFAALPVQLKTRVLDRLHGVLSGDDARERYSYIDADEKRRIYEILAATHPDAKARWAQVATLKQDK
ncbi:MAG: hypothetical protein JNL92_16880 [Opitutaceae bacterium]|nr:hypothetical protein [Opitutaceae bacterium]